MKEINRLELVWPGKYDNEGNLKVDPPVSLPFQIVERVNESRATRTNRETAAPTLFDIWEQDQVSQATQGLFKSRLIWGDNKLVLGSLAKSLSGKIKFIYIDPPFAVGADFKIEVEVGDESIVKEASLIEEVAFRDTWGNGKETFVSMLFARLRLIHLLLADDGVIAVHIDWRLSAQVRMLLDEIFGSGNFVNEIVWRYGKMSNAHRRFPQNHDLILVFSKSESYFFSPVRQADSEYKNRFIRVVENNKIKYGAVKDSQDKLILGRARKIQNQLGRKLRDDDILFDFDNEFKTQDDVFYDISIIKGNADERLDYPTQKPEALIERLLAAFTNEGDLVADFFCGSGTTLATAEKMNRSWIGCDLGRFAIHTTRKRLMDIKDCRPFEILNLGNYERQHWSKVSFGDDIDGDGIVSYLEYLTFILKLYGATPTDTSGSIHGIKGSAFVHIGSVASPVTIKEIEESIREVSSKGGRELHVLGWEWEMGLIDTLVDFAKSKSVKLSAFQIPREVMEEEAARKGQVTFFELSYLEAAIEPGKKPREFVCSLEDFVIPNPELIPDEVRKRVKSWKDYIDYWAVDWDFQNDTFIPAWMDYRTKADRNLKTKTSAHAYPEPGEYKVMVKVVDIFGNDSSKIYHLKVK
jgi:DNA modification methylase